jgi:hypothetical protein
MESRSVWREVTEVVPLPSPRNLACLRALVTAALFLAGTLGSSWFAVLEALKNADYALNGRHSSTDVVCPCQLRRGWKDSRKPPIPKVRAA